jgi:NAD(P)-dependent dehydrogenase (short-subunit alcohol dehydrogenase family)
MGDTESSLPYSPLVPNSSDEEHSKARGVVETDFWGTASMTLHAMRIMRENNPQNGKQGGLVIQITSMGGYMAFPGNAYYHAAKFAVEGFTESVRREVRPEWNIHFTIAEPGGIDTNYAKSSMSKLANHPAYDAPDSPARMLAAYVDDPEARKSWSRPEPMSQAIYEMASCGKPVPLRFPLGAVAWEVLRGKVESTMADFMEYRSLSVGVDGTEQYKDIGKVKGLY